MLFLYVLKGISEDFSSTWYGFKIVGDNIDKNVRPRYMRSDKQTRSLHYFNSYAVLDRVDCSKLSATAPHIHQPMDYEKILPMEDDLQQLMQNCTVLVTRILVEFLPFLGQLKDAVCHHIPHAESKAMAKKSVVVRYIA